MLPLYDNIPHRRQPWVNYLIIAACVVVYLFQLADPGLVESLAFRPAFLQAHHGESLPAGRIVLSAVATMFMHGGLLHLLFNMWFLWIFGDNVEDVMGLPRFLLFYLLSGLAAAGAQIATDPSSTVPMVGASGAIGGVLGAYARMYPRAHVHTLIFLGFYVTTVAVPAMFMLGYFEDGMPIMGLPGCVMYAGTTIFDLILPRIAAGLEVSRADIIAFGDILLFHGI